MKYFQVLLGVAISLGSGYYAFHDVEWERVVAAFSRLPMISLVPTLVMLGLFLLLRAYRWQMLVAPVQPVRLQSCWSATLIANDLLPLRAGEFVRAYALSQLSSLRISTAIATTVLERVWDAVAVALILVVTLSGIPLPAWLQQANIVLLILCVAVLVGGWFLARQGEGSFSRFSPRVAALIRSFGSGFTVLQSVPQLLLALVWSLAIWLALGGYYWVLLYFCGFTLPIQATFVVLIFTVFAAAIPAAPGFLGTYQVAMTLALQLYNIPKDEAVGFSLIAHAMQYVPVVVVGLIELMRTRLPLWPSRVGKVTSEQEPA